MKTPFSLPHRVPALLLVISLILAALPVAAAAPPAGGDKPAYVDAQAHIEFPATLAGFKYVQRKTFGEEALGYSVAYFSSNATITVYVFNSGFTDLGEGRQGHRVEQLFNQAKAELEKARQAGMYDVVEPLALKAPLAADITNRFQWASYRVKYSAQYSKNTQPLDSFLACTGHQGFCVKTRCTAPATANIVPNWSQFHQELIRLLEANRQPSASGKTPAAAPSLKP